MQNDIRRELAGILARDDIQDDTVCNRFSVARFLSESLLKSSLSFFVTSEMNLCDCLRDEGLCGCGRRCLRKLFEDIECLLILLPTL